MAASRVKRTGVLKETGYYRTLCGENEDKSNSTEEDSLFLTDDDVFEVERLVEKRIRKVNRPALSMHKMGVLFILGEGRISCIMEELS